MTEVVEPAAPAAPAAPPAAEPAPVTTPANPVATPAPAVAPKEPAAPIANGGVEPEPAKPVDSKWPDDWRQKAAGEDVKLLERLGRYDSPSALAKALAEAQDKIRAGVKPKSRPGTEAKPEEWAEYRKEAGIPEKAEDFVKAIVLPDKREIGKDDLPVVNAFAERAIKKGIAPADMAEMIDEYYAIQEEQANQQAEKDSEFKASSLQALREEWGGDYKANINAMRPYFDGVDGDLFQNLMGGRLADGSKIGDHPNVVKFFVAKALQENPAATVVPAGGNQVETIHAEIKAMEARMRDDRVNWFKDTAAQARYQKLIDAREKLASR